MPETASVPSREPSSARPRQSIRSSPNKITLLSAIFSAYYFDICSKILGSLLHFTMVIALQFVASNRRFLQPDEGELIGISRQDLKFEKTAKLTSSNKFIQPAIESRLSQWDTIALFFYCLKQHVPLLTIMQYYVHALL